jgi:hypothetical protein
MRKPLLLAMLALSCGDTAPPVFSTGPGVTSVSTSTSGTSSTGGDTSTGIADDSVGEASTGSSSTGVLRDVGAPPVDMGPPAPPGCQGKVDLLFVISRFYNMNDEQERLLASFPGFVDTVETRLEGFDLHLMVANPDGGKWPGWNCESYCNEDPQSCGEWGYKCNDLAWDVTACDETLGAGLIFNGGGGAANRHCELFGGNRYIISGEPHMEDAIECIAKVGWSGGVPPMGDAVVAALKYKLNADGGCNAGFLRKDALLVIVMISDIDDEESLLHPEKQFAAVVTAKGGDPNAIVAVAATPKSKESPDPTCSNDTNDWSPTRDFINLFPYHYEGDICEPSYAPLLDEAADLIEVACANYVPIPG